MRKTINFWQIPEKEFSIGFTNQEQLNTLVDGLIKFDYHFGNGSKGKEEMESIKKEALYFLRPAKHKTIFIDKTQFNGCHFNFCGYGADVKPDYYASQIVW